MLPPVPTRSTHATPIGGRRRRLAFGALFQRLQRNYHKYHLAKQQRHNKGLYEPGLLCGVLKELACDTGRRLGSGGATRRGARWAGNEAIFGPLEGVRLSNPAACVAPAGVYVPVAGYEDHFGTYLDKKKSETCVVVLKGNLIS